MSPSAAPTPAPGRLFVVAIEYDGVDVPAGVGGSRRPLSEHAFEVHSGLMPAPPRHPPRVGFPDPRRGWPASANSARCGNCALVVTDLVRDIIRDLVTTTHQRSTVWRADMSSDLQWLYPTFMG